MTGRKGAYDSPMVVNQDVQSANSPETITLRTSNDEVPQAFSAYEVKEAIFANTNGTQGITALQDYDDDGSTVETEVPVSVGADETLRLGDADDSTIIRIDRDNQIRVRTDQDVEVTLYLVPDAL